MILFLDPSPAFRAFQARRIRKRMAIELRAASAPVSNAALAAEVLNRSGFPAPQVSALSASAFALYSRSARRVQS